MHLHSVSIRTAAIAGMLALSVAAHGNPTGPEVVQGSATFNSAGGTLMVTPSGNAVIQWRNFNVAPGEAVRFVQPSTASSVINRITGGGYSVVGSVESNGRILFLNDTTVSGSGVNLDLAGVVDSSGRLQPIPASRRPAPRDDGPQRAIMLTGDRVFVIGADGLRRGGGRTLLVPGRGAELGDVRIPYVRVYVAAPSHAPVDLDALVTRRPALGMFNALFSPVPPARGDAGNTAVAAVRATPAQVEERAVLAFNAPVEERAVIAFSAPVEERIALALPTTYAPIEDRAVILFSAPVVERSLAAMPLVPAGVEERVVLAFNAPVEDRAVVALTRIPAPVEDRPVSAFRAPIEDRAIMALPVAPAPVEDRPVLVFRAPVETRTVAVFSAPVEEREVAVVWIAPAEERVIIAMARPGPGVPQPLLVALARPVSAVDAAAPDAVPIRVSSVPSMILPPVAVISSNGGAPVVKLPSVQRRLPRIMVDHRGAIFHL